MRKILILMLLVTPVLLNAQINRWKRYRYEVYGGVGVSNFLGELGGADKIGSKYYKDLEMSKTRPSFNVGMRYQLIKLLFLQSGFAYGWVSGDDSKTNETYRNNRNLKFRSPIIEFSTRAELALFNEKKGRRYSLRKVKGEQNYLFFISVFAGVGAFYFNPRGQGPDFSWYSLRKVGTEGQNFIESRKRYSPISMSFPVGVLVKYKLNNKWSIGTEFGLRPTLTDYIDDVSKTYVNGDLVAKHNENKKVSDEVAKYLADPSKSKEENPSWTAGGQQRGGSLTNDTYMFLFVNVYYKLKTTRKGLPRFN